ncbi:MAG TPA: site-specific DNA-methyltransferase [Geminicoccaceae bacterium]|nr:site-specific DNA-methyltransferase [Geminicoccaceae bacterium]
MQDLQVAWRPLGGLIPYARNPRTHTEAQVAQIAASIRAFGWTNPVLVDGANGIIAGHGRVLAARKLGLDKVPVIELARMSGAQKRAYVLADNQLALNAGWDEPLLRLELTDLEALGFDLGLIGFGAGELERLLAGESQEGLTDDDAAPELPDTPVTRPGDLWTMGEHRLLCGDATDPTAIKQVLDGSPADMTFTDPPYNVDYGTSAKDRLRGKHRPILNDNLGGGFEALLSDASVNILQVTKGACYICMSSSELDTLQRAFRAAGGRWSTFVIWAKSTFTLGRADYQRQYEPILYGWKDGTEHYWCGARDQGDVWFFDKPAKNDLHPTMKPVALVERAVRNSSKTRDVVLDPFGGSGSTLIACAKAGRRARLIELDPKYCDVIVRRWRAWTGERATLDGDGRSFEEVAAGRMAVA